MRPSAFEPSPIESPAGQLPPSDTNPRPATVRLRLIARVELGVGADQECLEAPVGVGAERPPAAARAAQRESAAARRRSGRAAARGRAAWRAVDERLSVLAR